MTALWDPWSVSRNFFVRLSFLHSQKKKKTMKSMWLAVTTKTNPNRHRLCMTTVGGSLLFGKAIVAHARRHGWLVPITTCRIILAPSFTIWFSESLWTDRSFRGPIKGDPWRYGPHDHSFTTTVPTLASTLLLLTHHQHCLNTFWQKTVHRKWNHKSNESV